MGPAAVAAVSSSSSGGDWQQQQQSAATALTGSGSGNRQEWMQFAAAAGIPNAVLGGSQGQAAEEHSESGTEEVLPA